MSADDVGPNPLTRPLILFNNMKIAVYSLNVGYIDHDLSEFP